MKKNPLIGKVITGMEIASDKESLRFLLPDGEVIANCDADCCSHTWVEHVELPALGFPATVIDARDVEMPDLGDMEGCDVVAYYGFKITTDRGEILIDYRNDSNGYYGGSLTWPGDHFYGGVHGQNRSNHEWQALEAAARKE